MDSDDDFGDFTFAPADGNSASFQFSSQLDVGTAFNTPVVESQCAASIRPMESNSDDDWGDFVEHSSLAVQDNSQVLDWFTISPQHSFPSQANSSLSSTDWKDRVEDAERKTDDLDFSALNLKGIKEVHVTTGSCLSDSEMAQKKETYKRAVSTEMNSSPISLSLFGDGELETCNLKMGLVDPATSLFQGHTRNTGARNGKDLSNLIADLYTEAQSLQSTKKSWNASLNEIDNSSIKEEGCFGFQSSPAGGSCDLEKSMLALNLGLENTSNTGLSKRDIRTTAAGSELEATTSVPLDSISMVDQCAFVEAWASMLAVCASELELALDIWKQALCADVHLALLADLQGKRYFAAIGQIYVVVLVLAATSNVYKPWLQVAAKKGESLRTDLERCKAVWLETNLKEGVQLALGGLESLMPTSILVPWKGIEQFSSVALEAYLKATSERAPLHSMCKICLLPMSPFKYSGLHPVEWMGTSYLLPLANLWANCVSQKPPSINLSI